MPLLLLLPPLLLPMLLLMLLPPLPPMLLPMLLLLLPPLLPLLLLPLPLPPIFGLPPVGFTSPDDGAAPVAAPPLTLVANGASSSERAPQASDSGVEAISRYNFRGGNVLQLLKGRGDTRDSFQPWTVQSNVLQPALG